MTMRIGSIRRRLLRTTRESIFIAVVMMVIMMIVGMLMIMNMMRMGYANFEHAPESEKRAALENPKAVNSGYDES